MNTTYNGLAQNSISIRRTFRVVVLASLLIVCMGLLLGCNRTDLTLTEVADDVVIPSPIPTKSPIEPSATPGVRATAKPTIPPTETAPPSPTPVAFLTAAAVSNNCLLPPAVVLPVDGRGNVNPVLTGVSDPDARFCIMWDSDVRGTTAFVVKISYMNGEVFTHTLPATVSYTILPEHEAPNCTDRTAYQVTVNAIVSDNHHLVGGLAVHDGCQ
jgi:hypothetical protein